MSGRARFSILTALLIVAAPPAFADPVAPTVLHPTPPAGPLPVPYPNTAAALQLQAGSPEIDVESFSWGAADQPPSVATSDRQEGGEIARKMPGLQKYPNVTLKRGQKAAIPGLTYEVVSPRDVATGPAGGKRQHEPLTLARGSVTVIMPEGLCVLGAQYPVVTLRSGDRVYSMQDVTVAGCTPATTAKGRKDKAKLEYFKVTMQDAMISG